MAESTKQHKTPNIKPKARHLKVAKELSENLGKPVGQILRENGYSESVSKTPQNVTETIGFKLALAQLGLTEELIASSLVEDIKAKPGKRVKELALGAEILGMKKGVPEEKPVEAKHYNIFFNPVFQGHIKQFEDVIKAQMDHEPSKESESPRLVAAE